MTHAENKLQWCLQKALKEGKKHRGLKEIIPNRISANNHIKKAEHNLEVMEYLIKRRYSDWVVNTAFYTQYHCLLAILQRFGFESRNQECTFSAINSLIRQGRINLDKADINKIFSTENETADENIINLRENFQYGIETDFEEQKIKELLNSTIRFIEKTKEVIQS